jgi:DNA-binding NtrC family response regulator
MTQLLHDRYYVYAAEHAWDLATGDSVPIADARASPPSPTPGPEPLIEVLDHGREGEPRWVVVEAPPGASTRAIARRAAEQARARGLVPIGASVYLRLRGLLHEDLRHRTLLLILDAGARMDEGRRALILAAAGSPRPHVLLSFQAASRSESHGHVVREARTAYGADRQMPTRSERVAVPGDDPRLSGLPEDVRRHILRGERWVEICKAGRHASAERLLRDVAAALLRRGALVPASGAQVALGRLLLERGRARDADAVFGEAAGHAMSAGDGAASATACIWQAAARTDAAQLIAAEALCRAVLIAGGLPGEVRARAEATLVRILLWQQRLGEAESRGLEALAEGHADAFVVSTAVRLDLAKGDCFEAGRRARWLVDQTEGDPGTPARVIALCTQARVLMETGDLVVAGQRMADAQAAARAARLPLRYVRVRLAWVDALRRSGRHAEANREIGILRRLRLATPPLLKSAIDGRLQRDAPGRPRVAVSFGTPSAAQTMIALARDDEHDRSAVVRVLQFSAEVLQSSRLDLWSADAGPDTTMVSVGAGLLTSVGPRVLDAGIVVDTGEDGVGCEMGVPVRLGSRLIAALVARWPVDRRAPPQSRDVLELAAAVAAPRIDAVHAAAREQSRVATSIPELVGVSEAIEDVRRAVTRAATAPFSVLIEGESGSGKELVARALHQLSPRRDRRFCDLNCAALPDELLESELFGHTRGAFTGAVADRAGLIEEADGGTLFLDEVADLTPRAQAKLLRVLQQQEVRRVGATFSRKVDVRVVSAANRDMRREAAEGRFRQDLLYRLDVVRIRVPPLRDRPEDVPVLVHHFWRIAAERVGTRAILTHGVMAALSRYEWPGNVRELQNVMASLAVAAPAAGQVKPGLLPQAMLETSSPPVRLVEAREQFERRFIGLALSRAGGRRARAARELGLSRQGLLKMMERLGLH